MSIYITERDYDELIGDLEVLIFDANEAANVYLSRNPRLRKLKPEVEEKIKNGTLFNSVPAKDHFYQKFGKDRVFNVLKKLENREQKAERLMKTYQKATPEQRKKMNQKYGNVNSYVQNAWDELQKFRKCMEKPESESDRKWFIKKMTKYEN